MTAGRDTKSRFSILKKFKGRQGIRLSQIGENWGEETVASNETVEYTLKQANCLKEHSNKIGCWEFMSDWKEFAKKLGRAYKATSYHRPDLVGDAR